MAFYNQIPSFPDQSFYYAQNPYENGYNDHYSYYPPPPQPSADFYSYEFAPTPSLIAYNHPGSIQYTVYHSVAGAQDESLSFPEYDPEPYKGGYDIAQTYGKPLPPSDDICYPNSSSAPPNPPPPTPAPVVKEVVNQEEELPNKAQLAEEENDDDDDDDDEDGDDNDDDEGEDDDGDDEEEEEDRSMIVYEGVEESNNLGREMNQMPHGYGLEAFDLCENLFGYWPCLSKMKSKCGTCGSEIKGGVSRGDEVDEWKRTADYLFGNPDPYGEWTHQGGPSAYPVYGCDQMQYQYHPQQSYAVYQQADQYAHNSTWFP